MKKILVALILCVSLLLCTACTSLSTYQDRLAAVNQEDGTYVISDFEEELQAYAEQYGLNPDDYSIIESISAENKKNRRDPIKLVVIATWSEAKAETLAADLVPLVQDLNNDEKNKGTYGVINDGRFVLVGDVRGVEIALGW